MRAEKCPHCQEVIDEGYAFYSALHVTVITQACSFANSIKYVDLIAFLAMGMDGLNHPGASFLGRRHPR